MSELRDDDFAFVYLDVDNLPIAWLAYRGVLVSLDRSRVDPGQLSWFLAGTIKRGLAATLIREGRLEGTRNKIAPAALSRLTSLYGFPSLEAARRADQGRGTFRAENLVAIQPIDGDFRCETHDMRLIDDFDALGLGAAERYWRPEEPEIGHAELLLSGRFSVLGTAVRKRAYETVRKADPSSLALLELARLAAWFGSDLGIVTPWIKQDERGLTVTYIVKYDESEGLEVFRRAILKAREDPGFAVNWTDLEPLTKPISDTDANGRFTVGDLRFLEHEFRVDKATALYEAMSAIGL